ncbi:MAG: hypothetical protein NVSMB29_10260 [Candidatus Dormibacteria bacterium]
MPRLHLPRAAVSAAAALIAGGLIGLSPHAAHAAAPPPCSASGPLCVKTTLTIPVAVGAGSPSSLPESCTVDADLYEPVARTPKSYPLILTTNGFGGNKNDQAAAATALASNNYVVLSYSGLGFGNSGGGCKISLDDPNFDGQAAKQIIDYLTLGATPAAPDVLMDTKGAVVGMIGGSYGGGVQFSTAVQDQRIRAIVPIITWNDLAYSLAPDNNAPSLVFPDSPPGVIKYQWVQLFFSVGFVEPILNPTFSSIPPPQTAPVFAPPCGGFLPAVCAAYLDTLTNGYPSQATLDLLRHASLVGFGPGPNKPAVMLMQGEADTLFNLDEAVANYNAYKASGSPVKLVFQSWGHSNSKPVAGEFSTTDPTASYEGNLIKNWFDHYLKLSGVSTGPEVEYFRDYAYVGGAADGTAAALVNAANAYAGASSYPVGSPVTLYPSADNTLHTQVSGITAGSPTMIVPANGIPASYSETSAIDPASQPPPADPPGESVSFTTAPLTAATQEVGIPTLTVTVNAPLASNTDPRFQPQLFTKIYDVAPDGSTTLPERLVSPARVPAGTSTVTLTLPGIVHQFAAGHRIRLTIASTDNAYINSRAPGVITFPISASSPDVLTLPIVGSVAGIQDVQAVTTQPGGGSIPVPNTGAKAASGSTALTLLTLGGLALRRRRRSR